MHKFHFMFPMVMLALLPSFMFAEQDITSKFIKNPSFEQQTEYWTVTDLQTQTNNSFTKKQGTTYLEKWTSKGGTVGNASVVQTLTALPAGKYKLTAAAQNIQQDSSTPQTGASIYAGTTTNSTKVTVAQDYDVYFNCEGKDVAIGFRAASASGNWICVDNFRLTYMAPDFILLQAAVANAKAVIDAAEKSSMAGIQPTPKANLLTAIAVAEALTNESTEEELTNASFDLAEKQLIVSYNAAALKELKTAANKARTRLSSDLAESYRQALQTAYDAAQAILALEDDTEIAPVLEQVLKAYEEAEASFQAKKTLKAAITAAERVYSEEKNGAAAFAEAIAAATAVRDSDTATPDEMEAAAAELEKATLIFRVENATGNPMNVKTGGVVQGATEIFGRASFSGGTAKEKGFCYSEQPEPTIYDSRSTTSYSNNGEIYAMQGLKPATFYYVRAYAITTGYQVSYGDVVKIPTRPLGNVTYNYDNAGDAATNQRINAACEEAVWMWNNITGIRNFHLDAHYVPGAGASGGTADCSYGGYMRISQNVPYQKTGTVLHEGSHGQGVINYTEWVDETYRTNGDRGDWLGPRVDRVIQFLDNSASAKLHGDDVHMWPYGINGANEDNGSPILYRANALVVGALAEDAITTPNMNFKKPAYSFAQDDETKYYIKNESTDRGLGTSYLRQKTAAAIRFEEMSADEVMSNDSCAWYITFNPSTCYYEFQNVATGRYLSMTTGTVAAATSESSARFQLMGSRNKTTLDDFTFAGTSYWIIQSSNHTAMNATVTGASSTAFKHGDDAVTQRWLFLTADEVTRFADARGETVGISPTLKPSEAQIEVVSGKGVVAISAHVKGQDVSICTLDGRSVQRLYVQQGATTKLFLPRGIYLVNSQKVIVR